MRRINIVPMAGMGKRFIDAGYKIPKPLVKVKGQHMFIRAAESLPESDHWIFICQENHIIEYHLDKIIKQHFPGSDIIIVDKTTNGQASSCMLAMSKVRCNDRILIGTCDNSMIYNHNNTEKLIRNSDVTVWTFRNNQSVLQNPNMYGWVKLNKNGKVNSISCKKAISETPLKDHAIIGTFSFRNPSIFMESVNNMINKNRTVNNEYYIDVAIDESINLGYEVRTNEVSSYTCWGTPKDVESYNNYNLY